jgi:hypothetical protein
VNRHPAYAAGTVITIVRADGTTVNVNTSGAAALNSETIPINGVNPITYNYPLTRTPFYVGQEPVSCTGWMRSPVSTDQPANVLTGCTWPGGAAATLAVNDPIYVGGTTNAGTPLLNGFIKIERRNAAGTAWNDVTLEWLNYGFAGPNMQGDPCGDPTPNAIIRLMRYRDNGLPAGGCTGGATAYNNSLVSTNYYPNMLFDAREGSTRLVATDAGMNEGGLFGYVAIDMGNFNRWVTGALAGTGNQTYNNNGYIIYFSDRRGDHDENNGDIETGEYGNEDSINPATFAWAKSNALEVGENFNESVDAFGVETMQTYGETPHALAVPGTAINNMQFNAAARPWTTVPYTYTGRGRMARPVLFRRALKIINGGIAGGVNNLPAAGINIVSENPVYVFDNFNATSASVVAEPNVPAAIIGDSITLLSGAFRDSALHEDARGLERHDVALSRIDGQPLLQPAGHRHLPRRRQHLQPADPRL